MSRALTRLRVLWARILALPRQVKLVAVALVVVAAALVVAFLAVGGGPLGGPRDFDAADASPAPYDGRSPAIAAGGEERVLVELPRPALGAVRDDLDPAEQRAYVASLRDEAQSLISALDARGVRLRDVVTYARAWHGFAATVSAEDRPRLESLGVRVRANRRLFPQLSQPVTVSPEAVAPAEPGADAPRVALLAGGVQRGRGYDAVGRDGRPRPAREEVGGESLAALLRGLGVRVRPIRVAGQTQISELVGAEELGRTDQLLDGLERAVDADMDGATDDHEDVAVLGVSSPYAGFADSPEAEAVAGARALGTLVVAPSGSEGTAVPGSSTIGSPGAAAGALTVAPLVEPGDVARTTLTAGDVRVRGAAVLGGGILRRPAQTAAEPVDATAPARLLGSGAPPLQGRVAVVRANGSPSAQASAAAGAGASAVILARTQPGPLPAMPAGRVDVPVLGVTGEGARALLEADGGVTVRTSGLRVPRAPFGRPFGTRETVFASAGSTFAGRPEPTVRRAGSVIAGGRLISGGAVAAAVVAAEAARASGDPDAREAAVAAASKPVPGASATPGATASPGASVSPGASATPGASPSPGATASPGASVSPAPSPSASPSPGATASPAPSPSPGASPSPAATPAPAVPIGDVAVVRQSGATGVLFVVGTFDRGDVAAGRPSTVVPAARLDLVLERAAGGVVERLTPTGGERGVLPGQYAYTLRPAVVRALDAGEYRFRVRAAAPGQATPTTAQSETFEAG